MIKPKRARIVDIAQESGVSVATVHRVLNNHDVVRDITRERVEEAITRLNNHQQLVGGFNASGEKLRFDFIMPAGAGISIDKILFDIVADISEKQGADYQYHFAERMNPQSFVDILYQVVEEGSKGIALFGIEHPSVRQAVDDLVDKGVPVVIVLSPMSQSKGVGFVGIDNRAAGRTAGYLMGRFLGRAQGKVAIIAGTRLYRSHEDREMGFRAVLREEFNHLEVLDVVLAEDESATNYSAISDLLERHPDVIGLYNLGSGSEGAAKAMVEKGRAQDVMMIVHNRNELIRPYLVSGAVDVILHVDLEQLAEIAIRTLIQANNHHQVELSALPFEIVLKENLLI
ncbi:MAG: LacI family DNA-binding transcriptional regulator [Arenicella sp.]